MLHLAGIAILRGDSTAVAVDFGKFPEALKR